MLTIEDLAMITGDLNGSEVGTDAHGPNVVVLSDDESSSSDDTETDSVHLVEDEMNAKKREEVQFANVSFLHGRTYATDMDRAMKVLHAELSVRNHSI